VLLLLALSLGACATRTPMQIGEVVERSQAQTPTEVIDTVRRSRTTYALKGSDFGKLADAGVSMEVLDFLQQSFVDDVDLSTRYWVLGENLGNCSICFPQQVDLNGLNTPEGPRQRPPYTGYTLVQPQGMPSWYVPYSVRLKSISIDAIRTMAKQGASEQDMLNALRSSRLERVIGVGGLGPVRTQLVAGVAGSELAGLRKEGIPDPVLDQIQLSFLSQFVEFERLRYQNLGKGPGGSFN
jgi:hypothetical protein